MYQELFFTPSIVVLSWKELKEKIALSLQVGNFRFLFPWLLIAFGTFDFTRLTSQLVVSNGVGNNKVTQKYFLDGSNPYFLASLGSKEEVTLVLP